MKILHTLQSYSPLSGGMYEVVKQISTNLIKNGHEIVIASGSPTSTNTKINGIQVESFDIKNEKEKYADFLINSNFDIITNFAAQQPMTDIALPILDKIKAKKVFVPTGFSKLHQDKSKAYFEQMKKWIKKYDLNIFLSNDYQDINFARENGVPEEKIVIIPNGASKEEFLTPKILDIRKKFGISKDTFLILHIGSFTGKKGHFEAIDIFSRANITNSSLLLIGNNENECSRLVKHTSKILNNSASFKKNNKVIIIPEPKREEAVSAFFEADLFLFPSNIECSPIVLFEAMASGLPFLSSQAGNAKEIISWGKAGILLPLEQISSKRNLAQKITNKIKKVLIKKGVNITYLDIPYSTKKIKESAKILEDIYASPEKRKKLGDNGRKAWLEKFSWEKISKRYEEEYSKLLKS